MSTETTHETTWAGNDPAVTPLARVRAKLDRVPDSDAVTVDKADLRAVLAEIEKLSGWHDAGLHADTAWDRFSRSRSPIEAADAVVDMNNAMSDLVSWLPGYDPELGRIPYDDE